MSESCFKDSPRLLTTPEHPPPPVSVLRFRVARNFCPALPGCFAWQVNLLVHLCIWCNARLALIPNQRRKMAEERCCSAEQALNLSRAKITAGGQESAGSGYGDCVRPREGGEGRAEGAMTIKMNHFSDRRQGTGRGGGGKGGITYACMRAMLQAGSFAKFLKSH